MERANLEPFKMVVRSQEAGSMVQFLDCYRIGHRLNDFLRTDSKYRGRNTSVQSVPSFALVDTYSADWYERID